MNFKELGISAALLRSLEEMGFDEATPIQEQTIPYIFKGRDLIGQAQTGTGKTCAYGIPAIQMTDRMATLPQVLVLCPTRELAMQVAEELRRLTKFVHEIRILAIYGGQNIEHQITALKKRPQIIIGTPGRVMDHMRRRTLRFDQLKMLVLDEADEMLNMGFREDIDMILTEIPPERQMLLFSATMAPEIVKLTETYQTDPVYVHIAKKALTTELTEQYYIEVREDSKTELLCRLIDRDSVNLGLVFCNTKKRVDQLTARLQDRGCAADALHGDMKQLERERVMNKFRHGLTRILVATDVAARGIDVSGVQAVFNYDIPEDPEQYVHRIGRTGRAGNRGKAYSFVFGRDMYKLREIMRYTGSEITKTLPPKISEVESVRIGAAAGKVAELVSAEEGSRFLPVIHELIDRICRESGSAAGGEANRKAEFKTGYVGNDADESAGQTESGASESESQSAMLQPAVKERADAAARLAAALFSLAFSELNGRTYQHMDFDEEEFSYEGLKMTRLFINAGRMDGLTQADIVKAVTSRTSIAGRLMGSVEIHTNFSFTDVPEEYVDEIVSVMKNVRIRGRAVSFERASKKRRGRSSGSFGRKQSRGSNATDRRENREHGKRNVRGERREKRNGRQTVQGFFDIRTSGGIRVDKKLTADNDGSLSRAAGKSAAAKAGAAKSGKRKKSGDAGLQQKKGGKRRRESL